MLEITWCNCFFLCSWLAFKNKKTLLMDLFITAFFYRIIMYYYVKNNALRNTDRKTILSASNSSSASAVFELRIDLYVPSLSCLDQVILLLF
jgi:hypothetical protein